MARVNPLNNDWRMTAEGMPDWIPEDQERYYPGCGHGNTVIDWIPDPNAPPEVTITKEQEMYGMGWKPGMPETPFEIDKKWRTKKKVVEVYQDGTLVKPLKEAIRGSFEVNVNPGDDA